jgi:hypothetical protein
MKCAVTCAKARSYSAAASSLKASSPAIPRYPRFVNSALRIKAYRAAAGLEPISEMGHSRRFHDIPPALTGALFGEQSSSADLDRTNPPTVAGMHAATDDVAAAIVVVVVVRVGIVSVVVGAKAKPYEPTPVKSAVKSSTVEPTPSEASMKATAVKAASAKATTVEATSATAVETAAAKAATNRTGRFPASGSRTRLHASRATPSAALTIYWS